MIMGVEREQEEKKKKIGWIWRVRDSFNVPSLIFIKIMR